MQFLQNGKKIKHAKEKNEILKTTHSLNCLTFEIF